MPREGRRVLAYSISWSKVNDALQWLLVNNSFYRDVVVHQTQDFEDDEVRGLHDYIAFQWATLMVLWSFAVSTLVSLTINGNAGTPANCRRA